MLECDDRRCVNREWCADCRQARVRLAGIGNEGAEAIAIAGLVDAQIAKMRYAGARLASRRAGQGRARWACRELHSDGDTVVPHDVVRGIDDRHHDLDNKILACYGVVRLH